MRPLRLLPLLSAVVLLAAACDGGEQEVTVPGHSVDFRTVDQGDQSGVQLQGAQVSKLDTGEEWLEFWADHTSNLEPPPEPPEIDFGRETVIAVLDQQQPSGGYSIEITEVRRTGGEGGALEVSATQRRPGAGCVTTDVITQPYHIVRVAKLASVSELVLSIEQEEYGC